MILTALRDLVGRRPIPFQTLNFAVGTQQRLHADTIHFDSLPSGSMVGVWVALEDVEADQGPVRYVPGSHRLPVINPADASDDSGEVDYSLYEDLVEQRVDGMPVEEFHARSGEVLIWAANLVHGGAAVRDSSATRWSQVTHYFFEGDAYITPMLSDMDRHHYRMREPLIDISTGERVTHVLDGEPVRFVHVRHGRSRLLGPGDPPPPIGTRALSTMRGAGRIIRRDAASTLSRMAGIGSVHRRASPSVT